MVDVAEVAPQGDTLLQVKMVGMCGTDLNTYRGRNAMVSFPRILGHEVAAIVVEGGEDLAAGTAVTMSPYTNCGICPACLRGRVRASLRNVAAPQALKAAAPHGAGLDGCAALTRHGDTRG